MSVCGKKKVLPYLSSLEVYVVCPDKDLYKLYTQFHIFIRLKIKVENINLYPFHFVFKIYIVNICWYSPNVWIEINKNLALFTKTRNWLTIRTVYSSYFLYFEKFWKKMSFLSFFRCLYEIILSLMQGCIKLPEGKFIKSVGKYQIWKKGNVEEN